MFISAGNGEDFSFSKSMGVGSIQMAINLTQFLLTTEKRPKNLIFVGTAGSYGEIPLFEIVNAKTASNIELSFLTKSSYTPIENVVSTGESPTIVNSSNYITTDSEISKSFLKMGIGLENMEFFSFLSVAQKFGIPAGGVFVVTNFTNRNAHQDFLQNRENAMKLLENFLKNSALKDGAS
jgi:purine-nucleoside phosphorylase